MWNVRHTHKERRKKLPIFFAVVQSPFPPKTPHTFSIPKRKKEEKNKPLLRYFLNAYIRDSNFSSIQFHWLYTCIYFYLRNKPYYNLFYIICLCEYCIRTSLIEPSEASSNGETIRKSISSRPFSHITFSTKLTYSYHLLTRQIAFRGPSSTGMYVVVDKFNIFLHDTSFSIRVDLFCYKHRSIIRYG